MSQVAEAPARTHVDRYEGLRLRSLTKQFASATVMAVDGSPVTFASSASQPSPNTLSDFNVTFDRFCVLAA